MNVIYAADDNFAPILSVSIASLCENNRAVNIYIIDNNISRENKKIINRIVEKSLNEVRYVTAVNKLDDYNFKINTDRGSMAQFSRLFIEDILPVDIERILYLDCDTLIESDLTELFSFNMDNYVIAGVEDSFSKYHRKCLGLKPKDTYINSGVMLINMFLWRAKKVEEKLIQYICLKNGEVLQGDQGTLNAVLSKFIKVIDPKWNVVTYLFDFTYEEMKLYRAPSHYYEKEVIAVAKKQPKVIHFTTSFASMRPWQNKNTDHPYAEKWRTYFYKNGYKIERCADKNSLKVYRMFPKKMMLLVLRVIHSYLKPLKYYGKQTIIRREK